MKTPSDLLERLKDITITKKQAEKLSSEEKKNKFIRGVLFKEDRPEYIEEYDRITGFKEVEV